MHDADVDVDYTAHLVRNLALGTLAAFVITTVICFIGSGDLQLSLKIGVVPSLFTGPYVGLLLNLGLSSPAEEPSSGGAAAENARPAHDVREAA